MLKESHAHGAATPPLSELTIGTALAQAAAEAPDKPALIAGVADPAARRTWTYGELYEEATRAAHALLARFQPGERVAAWAPNIPEWIILEYACGLAGVIMVTVNPAYQPRELEYVLKQSRSAGVFLLPEFRGNRMLHHLESIRDNCLALREVVLFTDWDAFLASGAQHRGDLPQPTPDTPCMIQYTSGTTGFPKGALLHHRGLVNNGAQTFRSVPGESGAPMLGIMPLFHTGGCVLVVLGSLSLRVPIVLVEQFDPGLTLELMEHYRIGGLFGVPTMLNALLEHPGFPERDLSAVHTITSGGATVPAALVRRLEEELGASFNIVFGQTECSPVCCMTSPDDDIEDKANTLGRAMPHTELKVVDVDSGATQPIGALGELCTRGYHVMHEYFEKPDATAEAIDGDGWLHTGDLASMDGRGYCRIEGRLKDMIIRGGENIYPREIEELLYRHPSVSDVAVVGVPDERMGEEVAAFLRAAPGNKLHRSALFAYLREHLSPQKTPRHWIELQDFPMTGSGKIQKFELRRGWTDGNYREMPVS